MSRQLITIICVIMMTGCASEYPKLIVDCASPIDKALKGPALVGQGYGMQMTQLPLDALQFTSSELANSIAVQSVFAKKTPADTVQVTARIVNCTGKPIAVLARTSFMDSTHAPTEAISAWRTVYIPPKSISLYHEISSSINAWHYMIELAKE